MPRKGGGQASRKKAELVGEGLGASSRSRPVDENQLGHDAAIPRTALVWVKGSPRTRNRVGPSDREAPALRLIPEMGHHLAGE